MTELFTLLGTCRDFAGRFDAAQATLQQAQGMHPGAAETLRLQREVQVTLQHGDGRILR